MTAIGSYLAIGPSCVSCCKGIGGFYVKFSSRNKMDGFQWVLTTAVYEAPQLVELKGSIPLRNWSKHVQRDYIWFLSELGDFHIIRNPLKKINAMFDDRRTFLFNVVINGLNLSELELLDKSCLEQSQAIVSIKSFYIDTSSRHYLL